MTREELMKMSKKDLKARLATLNRDAQARSGEELQAIMDEATEISGILADIANREKLAGMVQDGTEEPPQAAGVGEEGNEVKDKARADSGRALKDGKAVKYKAKTLAHPKNTLTTSGVVMPHHTSPDISPTFNDVSSLIDRVKTVPLPGGESYQRPFVKSYGDGAGSTAENADYNTSEPEFGYADISREKITAYAEEPEEMQKLPNADYDGVVEESVVRAIKRYASRQILIGQGGAGKFRGIFFNPTSATDDIIDRNTDITTITTIDDGTLDEIIYSYGGDEEVEDVAVLILNKKDLKKFAKLRDKQGRKVYTIANHGNTGTIDEVPYIINSVCNEVGGTAGKYCMAYGPLSNYEVTVFSDIEAQKSTEYKFKQGQIAYKACVFMGGNVVAKNGFIRVKNADAESK